MDNINQTGNRSVNFAFTQSIGNYSADQLNKMDISDLMTLVMTRMVDAKELQFKQKLEEADARTKRLETLGDQYKAVARLNAVFGANDKDDTSIKDAQGAKDKISADQWDQSSADFQIDSSNNKKPNSSYRPYSDLTAGQQGEKTAWFKAMDSFEASLTEEEKTYLRETWNRTEDNVGAKQTGGNPVLDAQIKAKFEKAWHAQGYEPPKGLKADEVNRIYGDHYQGDAASWKREQFFRAYVDYNLSPDTTASTSNSSQSDLGYSTWRDGLSEDGRQFMADVDTFCSTGQANGTLTEADVAKIKSGDFKKSDIEAIQVAIKNEQDQINSMNTRDQLDIQRIANQIDQCNNIMSTLIKKFNESSTNVINRM